MTIDEIFSEIISHMIEGLMVHSQMADYYGFLGLKGYQECHKYHYFEESSNYKKIGEYFLEHFNKIPMEKPVSNPQIVPNTWYQHSRQDVSIDTKKSSIKTGIEKWINWEENTKKLYERLYQELISIREIAASAELQKYIIDVDNELAEAYQIYIKLSSIDYNLSDIVLEQDAIYKKCCKRLKEIELC